MNHCSSFDCSPYDHALSNIIAKLAVSSLKLELFTYPKPGLVSHRDNGSHQDMNANLLERSAEALLPFFADIAQAGAHDSDMSRLRTIGLAAERAMFELTGGVNTHKGAIFGMGLLVAAAGLRAARNLDNQLGTIVSRRWGKDILIAPPTGDTHGAAVKRQYGAGGTCREAASGMPSVYTIGLPELRKARLEAPSESEAIRVQACMALIASVEDTNLLYRGGRSGLLFAQRQAVRFLKSGGITNASWRANAEAIHGSFVKRGLSPGGAADLLAMTLFADHMEA